METKYILKHHGKEMHRGSRITCEYTLQRTEKDQSPEQALESGDWTITPWTGETETKTIMVPSKLNFITFEPENKRTDPAWKQTIEYANQQTLY